MDKAFELHSGDCLEVMKGMLDSSVDAIVTDPPYGLGFMGKKWDYDVPSVEVWTECLRVLKPGGHLLTFGGARTYHRLAVNVEDAGFEIRDQIMWVYGSGFPKSMNLAKQPGCEHLEGWGTALKPAHEPILMARKPLDGTVAGNVLTHGTGALNIDDCRVGSEDMSRQFDRTWIEDGSFGNGKRASHGKTVKPGRWPANLIHDGSDEVLVAFPDAKGQQGKSEDRQRTQVNCYGAASDNGKQYAPRIEGNKSAARFFYCAKTSKKDREEGLDDFVDLSAGAVTGRQDGSVGLNSPRAGAGRTSGAKNHHPTVKPTELMAYLCRLITPPSGVVLDPFMGSGSTGKAATAEGFQFIGIEMDPEYLRIAQARIEFITGPQQEDDLEDLLGVPEHEDLLGVPEHEDDFI